MKLIEVVILVGSQCLSPLEAGPGITAASKVQCAVLIRQDPETEAVELVPRTAATDPEVIAILARPATGQASEEGEAQAPDMNQPATAGQEFAKTDRRPLMIVSDEGRKTPIKTVSLSGKKMQARSPAAAVAAKKKYGARRTDSCGSYKAVWYTNKYGRRKYRCVRAG